MRQPEENCENRRRNNSFAFHQVPYAYDNDDSSATTTTTTPTTSTTNGLIAEILDGVVFTPPGSEAVPRPPPDNRSRSALTSFRSPSPPPSQAPPPTLEAPIKSKENVKIDTKILFQQELNATIKKRQQSFESGNFFLLIRLDLMGLTLELIRDRSSKCEKQIQFFKLYNHFIIDKSS